MARMRLIAMLLAAVAVAGCQGSATEDAPPPPVDPVKTNPGPAKGNPGPAKANPGPAGATSAEGSTEEPLRLDSAEAAALLGIDDDLPKIVLEADPSQRADNSRCLVCHDNFTKEELSIIHAAYGVGCEKCHGSSNAHCSDENNITPPDVMFPRDSIVKACMECHPAEKLSNKEHHWDVFAPKKGKPKKVCTDCHGNHRIATRDVRWNKKTGKLIKGGWMEEGGK